MLCSRKGKNTFSSALVVLTAHERNNISFVLMLIFHVYRSFGERTENQKKQFTLGFIRPFKYGDNTEEKPWALRGNKL